MMHWILIALKVGRGGRTFLCWVGRSFLAFGLLYGARLVLVSSSLVDDGHVGTSTTLWMEIPRLVWLGLAWFGFACTRSIDVSARHVDTINGETRNYKRIGLRYNSRAVFNSHQN